MIFIMKVGIEKTKNKINNQLIYQYNKAQIIQFKLTYFFKFFFQIFFKFSFNLSLIQLSNFFNNKYLLFIFQICKFF